MQYFIHNPFSYWSKNRLKTWSIGKFLKQCVKWEVKWWRCCSQFDSSSSRAQLKHHIHYKPFLDIIPQERFPHFKTPKGHPDTLTNQSKTYYLCGALRLAVNSGIDGSFSTARCWYLGMKARELNTSGPSIFLNASSRVKGTQLWLWDLTCHSQMWPLLLVGWACGRSVWAIICSCTLGPTSSQVLPGIGYCWFQGNSNSRLGLLQVALCS